MTESCLSELRNGDCFEIHSLDLYPTLKQRLLDLGMIPGKRIQCAYVAPSGSPMAFWVKGALIALRLCDCSQIQGIKCCE